MHAVELAVAGNLTDTLHVLYCTMGTLSMG